MTQRQEVVNVVLAQLLAQRGLVAAPEQVLQQANQERRLPDVLVDYRGLRLAIEAEFNARTGNPATRAYDKATERVEEGLAHIGVAIVYPALLRRVAFERLGDSLQHARLQFGIISERRNPQTQLHLFEEEEAAPPMLSGSIDDLIEALRRSYTELARDDTVERAVELIEASIAELLQVTESQPGATGRLVDEIGVQEVPSDETDQANQDGLSRRQRIAVSKIAALILENALVFQEILSQTDSRVCPLQRFRGNPDVLSRLRDHWQYILDEINYYPIFHVAHGLLGCFSSDEALTRALSSLIGTALRIVACRAALRHDLAGRIYHRLLEEAKYLGAFYTSIPAAALLLKLALRPDRFSCDWSSQEALQSFHVADLACGTGTLLMAAADVITDNYVRACVEEQRGPDLNGLQQGLVAHTIYGYDVLSSAVHLTASTLALRVPETPVNVTHLYRMPLGGPQHALGTLEFLSNASPQGTLFGEPEQVTGTGLTPGTTAIPRLDLCVMNPPFTRSVGVNRLFGNCPQHERPHMQRRLRDLVSRGNYSASITAGLGSVFVALGERHLKPTSSLALVLPRTLLSGAAWGRTRELLEQGYRPEYIIVSHEPGHWNFSENTSLSETLVVLRKAAESQDGQNHYVQYINLWRQPRSATEALSVASELVNNPAPCLDREAGALEITVGDLKVGEASSVAWADVQGTLWSLPCAFAQHALNRVFYHLRHHRLVLPGAPQQDLPLTSLGSLGVLGFDRRDIHDGFSLSRGTTEYPAIWGQQSRRNRTLLQRPNRWLHPLSRARQGRNLRHADVLWARAGRVLLAERMRLNTSRLAAAWSDEPVLANVWWTFVLEGEGDTREAEKALVLWLNSSLGLTMLMGYRSETEGAFVDFKKPALSSMPVLDVLGLPLSVIHDLAAGFDHLCTRELQAPPRLCEDQVRCDLDYVLCECLQLSDLSRLREALAREPILAQSMIALLPGPAH